MKSILLVVFIYLIILGVSYYLQDKFVFFPQKLGKDFDYKLPSFAKELTLTASDGTKVNAIFYQHPHNKKIIIYFHGNAGSLNNWKNSAEKLLQTGCNILIIDYRGYGKTEGTFSEEGFYKDAEASYHYAKTKGYMDNEIIFYGRSLGSGIAVEMALRHAVAGLILETPYTSLTRLAQQKYWYLWPNLLMRYKFNNLEKVAKLTIPVLLLHGDHDELIPKDHSIALNKIIKSPHTLVIIPNGNHNNLANFSLHQTALNNFLKELDEP